MLITTQMELDLKKPSQAVTVYAVQGDRNARCIQAALCSGGEPWQVPEGVKIAIRFRKPDMTGGYYDTMPDGSAAWSAEGNLVTVLLAPQMLTISGTVVAQLELFLEGSTLGSFTFYVSVEPDPSAGILTSEDYVNWTEWMEQQVTERLHDAIANGDFRGPVGQTGEAAVLLGAEVGYQMGSSATEPPEGTWLNQIPEVLQGCFLWSRTVYTFNTGEPVTQYAVSYMGKDYSGVRKIPAVLLASGWSDVLPYTQQISVDPLSEADNVRAYPQAPEGTLEEKLALNEALTKVRWCTRSGSTLTFECLEEKPAVDIPVIVEVYV